MHHLIITVMAIALAGMLTFAGASYFRDGLGAHLVSKQTIQSQKAAIDIAITAYRQSNNALYPVAGDAEQRLVGFLPDGKLPKMRESAATLSWVLFADGERVVPCMRFANEGPSAPHIRPAVIQFATEQANAGYSVSVGTSCNLTPTPSEEITDAILPENVPSIFVTFLG